MVKWPLVLFLISLFAIRTRAQYYNTVQHIIGEKAAGLGGAYIAYGDNSSSIWYNPAGLAQIRSPSLNVSASSYSYLKTGVEGALRLEDTTGNYRELDLNQSDFSIVGNSLIFGTQITRNSSIAYGLVAPFQQNLKSLMNGQVIGTQLQTDIKRTSTISSKYYLGLFGIGFKLGSNFRLGATVGVGQYSRTIIGGDFRYLTLTNIEANFVNYQENSLIAATAISSLGAQVELSSHVFGLYAKSPTYNLTGRETRDYIDYFVANDSTFPTKNISGRDSKILESFSEIFPIELGLGYAYKVPYSFGLSLDLLPVFPATYNGNPNWTVNMRFGSELYLGGKWVLRSGFFTDFSQKDPVTPVSPHPNAQDYYGATFSFSNAKIFSYVKNKVTSDKVLWSTVGVYYRYGMGQVQTFSFDGSLNETTTVEPQGVQNVTLYIAESVIF